MGKVKGFISKYKWWIVGVVGFLVVFMMLRGGGGGGGGGDQAFMPYTDPNAMAMGNANAQRQHETDALNAKMNHDARMAQIESDNQRFKIESDLSLGMAGIDLERFKVDLNSTTGLQIAGIESDMKRYVADTQLSGEKIRADVTNRQTEAGKYIVGKQADVAKYQAKTARQGQMFGFLGSFMNSGFVGRFF